MSQIQSRLVLSSFLIGADGNAARPDAWVANDVSGADDGPGKHEAGVPGW
jgi:hypothetical protein